jgi:predicted AlkP superfamily phosphohydrolase/phosphomutase
VYLALDSCDLVLARDLVRRGHMPNLGRLLDAGAHAETKAPYGTFVGSIWPTIATGTRPGAHGLVCWIEVEANGYRDRLTTPRDMRRRSVWEILGDAGHRVAVIDVPHALPPAQLNGVLVCEYGAHDRHEGPGSFPRGLLAELIGDVGPHPINSVASPPESLAFAPCDAMHRSGDHRTPAEDELFTRDLVTGVARKTALSTRVLAMEPWDLFMSVLGEAHCAGHQQWHLHDPAHPWHLRAGPRRGSDPLVTVYAALDDAIGAHLALTGPDTWFGVHLTHGMGPHYDGTHILDAVLWGIESARHHGTQPGMASRLADVAQRVLPSRARRGAGAVIAGAGRGRASLSPPPTHDGTVAVPRAERRWFQTHNNTVYGGIRFNVVGREPNGMIDPADVAAVSEQLRADLLDVVNVDSGEPAVRRVVPTAEREPRPAVDAWPDLLVEWNRSHLIERLWSPRIGTVHVPYLHNRSGDHHLGGLLVATGPGIEPGPLAGPIDVEHIAPTFAAALGSPLDDVDGRPIAGLLPGAVRV